MDALSDKILRRVARTIAKSSDKSGDWVDLAYELSFSREMIEGKRREMDSENWSEVDKAYYFLAEWRDEGDEATVDELLRALSQADLEDAAESYQRELMKIGKTALRVFSFSLHLLLKRLFLIFF